MHECQMLCRDFQKVLSLLATGLRRAQLHLFRLTSGRANSQLRFLERTARPWLALRKGLGSGVAP